MPIITLTTDFGTTDGKVACIKGCILSMQPDVSIVDISHDIEPYNLTQTGYIVKNAYSHFPKGSIHIISVDSFYHKDRKFLVCKADGHYFIMADNGLPSLIFYDIKPESIHEITLNNRFDDVVNFTSTDIFVPVAVHLYKGGIPEIIGREIQQIKEITYPKPYFNENEKILIGEVVYIDHFGNAVSNISKEIFEQYFLVFKDFDVKFRGFSTKKIVEKYTDIIPDWEKESSFHGKELALFNEADLLEIAIYKGSKASGASALMGLNIGEKIYVVFN